MSIAKLIELAQNKDKIKEICKENENTICPKDIYRFENRIVIEYENEIIAIPIRKRPTYEQWAEKRDKKLMRIFRKLRQLKQEYAKQKEIVKQARNEYYKAKRQYKAIAKQWEALKLPTLELLMKQKFIEYMNTRDKYRTEQAKLRAIKTQIKAIKKHFERARKVAKAQFESYKPMHSLPVSNWKDRIKEVLSLMNLYFEKGDINGFVLTKQLNRKDIEFVSMWHEWLNEQIYELTFDLLAKHFDSEQDNEQKFKKPMLIKLLQSHMYTFSFDNVMQSIMLWLKTKP